MSELYLFIADTHRMNVCELAFRALDGISLRLFVSNGSVVYS